MQDKGCGWGRVHCTSPQRGGRSETGKPSVGDFPRTEPTGTAMPGAKGPWVGSGPLAGANTPRGGVPLDKEGMQGKQKESSGEETAGLCVCGLRVALLQPFVTFM